MNPRRIVLGAVIVAVAIGGLIAFSGDDSQQHQQALNAATSSQVTTTMAPETTVVAVSTSSAPTTSVSPQAVGVPGSPQPPPQPPSPGIEPGFDGAGLITAAAGGADVARTPGGRPYVRIREGVVMGSVATAEGWIEVVTSCDTRAWLPESQVRAEAPAPPLVPGSGTDFADAMLVIDPGHGGPSNQGAPSPDGVLIEKEVNLDIAHRVRDLLSSSHDVDWVTGTIYLGDTVPAAGRVIVSRSGAGADADYEAGLLFRAALADALQAHALVSIHNNAGSNAESDVAASDVYYQSDVPASRRLAAILSAEFARGFAPFEADWVATLPVGAKSRLSPRDGETQYYGILRRSSVPAVIAEGAYIANQSEADLLATPEFRQAYADAVYRALVRFITTDDEGGVSYDPVVWEGNAGSGDAGTACTLPEQPAP